MRGHDGRIETDVSVLKLLFIFWTAFSILLAWLVGVRNTGPDVLYEFYPLVITFAFSMEAGLALVLYFAAGDRERWQGMVLTFAMLSLLGVGVSILGFVLLLLADPYSSVLFPYSVIDLFIISGALVLLPLLFLRQFRILAVEGVLIPRDG